MGKHPQVLLVLGSSSWGGGERHCLDLLLGLQQSFDFGVAAPNDALIFSRLPGSIRQHPLNSESRLRRISELLQISRQYEIVHAHLNRAAENLLPLRLARIPARLLATIHGMSSPLPYLGAHRLIAVSKAVQNSLPGFLQQKTSVIYNGVETLEHSCSTPSSPLRFSLFATIHPNKGQLFVARSLKNYPLEGIRIHMVGTGSPQNMAELQQSIEGQNILEFTPKIQNLESFWEKTDVLLVPSYQEALSYVALESLSRGIPVLASRTGGLAEVLVHPGDGLLFEPGNHTDFRQKIEELKEKLPRMQKHLKEFPFLTRRPEFQLTSMLESTRTIYQSLLLNRNH